VIQSRAFLANTGPEHWYTKEQETSAKKESVAAAKARSNLPAGCLNVDALNIEKEITRSDVPTMLYFHVTSHPEILAYTQMLCNQVADINREAALRQSQTGTGSDPRAATGEAPKLAVKLGLLNCEKEAALAQQFRINPHQFPLLYFLIRGNMVDQAVGIMEEIQIRDALVQFIDYYAKNVGPDGKIATQNQQAKQQQQQQQQQQSGSNEPNQSKPQRIDEDDENPVTLLQAAVRKIHEKDYSKGTMLLNKAEEQALPGANKLKEALGVGKKKMTPEMLERMRKDPSVMVLPQIMCARAMMALGRKRYDDAFAHVETLRRDYPWAPRDSRVVADALCRIEMIRLADYDIDRDNYITLMKNDEQIHDPLDFYFSQIKLACCHYFERHADRALEELLKVVRMEPKIMKQLKDAGYLDKWAQWSSPGERASGANTSTLARRLLFLVFEAVGNDHQMVVAARKRLAAYL
jgi:thioredoxin-like negative regulator of GroEL